jgi:hypothetical protein
MCEQFLSQEGGKLSIPYQHLFLLFFWLKVFSTFSLVLREEHRLQIFKNKRERIFGPERKYVTEGGKKTA